jgi:hypothetical protein
MEIDDEFAAAAVLDYLPGKMPRRRPNIDGPARRPNRASPRDDKRKSGTAANDTLKPTQTAEREAGGLDQQETVR